MGVSGFIMSLFSTVLVNVSANRTVSCSPLSKLTMTGAVYNDDKQATLMCG